MLIRSILMRNIKRQGSLFEGRYKAVRIPTDELLIHTSRYIHLNPVVANLSLEPDQYQWSVIKSISMSQV